jgi:hypothetical protein
VGDEDKECQEPRPPVDLSDELLDKYYDIFKHMTTLNVATAVVSLAIYNGSEDRLASLAVPLLAFGASLVAAMNGLEAVLSCLRVQDRSDVGVRLLWLPRIGVTVRIGAAIWIRRSLVWCLFLLGGGLVTLASHAFS